MGRRTYFAYIKRNFRYASNLFHFTERRIEAHICICFIAYKVYKELERLIVINNIGMSADNVLDAEKTITTIRVRNVREQNLLCQNAILDEETSCCHVTFQINKLRFLV